MCAPHHQRSRSAWMELPGNTFWSSSCRHQSRFYAFTCHSMWYISYSTVAIVRCVSVCVCLWSCETTVSAHVADLIMTSSVRHIAKNICHHLYADGSPAFQGNDLHLSASTDHLSWFRFSSKSQSLKRQEKHRGLWAVVLWSDRY